jgi:hypothetical protein
MRAKSEPPQDEYDFSDARKLHPNLLISNLQVLFWLFFCPSAWHNHVTSTDPTLSSDFALTDLSQRQFRAPALRRLIVLCFVWPGLISLGVGLWRWISGAGPEEIIGEVLHGLIYGATGGIVVSMAVSLAAGIVYGAVISLLVGLAPEGGILIGVIYSLAAGVTGSVAATVASGKPGYSWRRQLGGGILGVLVGGIALAAVYGMVSGSALGRPTAASVQAAVNTEDSLVFGLGIGFLSGIGYGAVLWWQRRRWRPSLLSGTLVGIGLAYSYLVSTENEMLRIVASGIAGGTGFGAMFAFGFLSAQSVGGAWAGAIAGGLVSGMGWVPVERFAYSARIPLWPTVPICLVVLLLGLTMSRWRPLVLYPLLATWNTWLYHRDRRRLDDRRSALRWHSAFWDEHQWLPLTGLDEHLVMILERNPAEGQAALEYLATDEQRWAVQAAQIEIDARRLERCPDTKSIGQAHGALAAGELKGPASTLLHSLSSISRDIQVALNQTTTYHKRLALCAVEDRLNGLLRELNRSSERYTVRFRPVVIHWRQLVVDHVNELAQAVERHQEIDNPYIIGVPLSEQQEMFVGRVDISARIEQLLLARHSPPLFLFGQRRMGKTSLLRNLGRLLSSSIVPLFVDLQGPVSSASDHAGFLYNIARGMRDSARRQRELALPPLARETLVADPFTRFDEWLDEVEEALGSHAALLALDEFEALDSALKEGRFSAGAALGMLRHVIQHRPRFKVLVAASHTLDELGQWSSYLINIQVVHLSYLKEHETLQLVERPMEDFALRYEPDASRRVLDLTRGHPALVQLLCYEIVTLKNEQDPELRRLARLADVEAAIPRALNRGTVFFFHDIQQRVGDTGLAILRFIAAQGERAVVSRQELACHLPYHLERTLTQLLQYDLINRTGDGYQFEVELIRRWFQLEVTHDEAPQ